MSHCINLRRSAILTEIVTRFLTAAVAPKGDIKLTALADFLDECREQVAAKRALFDAFTKEDEA